MWPFKKIYFYLDPFCTLTKSGIIVIMARSGGHAIRRLRKVVSWEGYKRDITKEDLKEIRTGIGYIRGNENNSNLIG